MGVLFTHPVGCPEVFLQATETGPDSEKKITKRQTMKNAFDEDEAVRRQVSPLLFTEPPACLRVNRVVVFFDSFELLFFSLSYLLTARDDSVVLLGSCQVLVVQSFAFSFRLSKVRSLM